MKSNNGIRTFTAGLPDEDVYFAYSAMLRVSGLRVDFEAIERNLGLSPTSTHRKGERRRPNAPPYNDDLWAYASTLPEEKPLAEHIDFLWNTLKPKQDFLHSLQSKHKVDIFLGYRTNCDNAGLVVPHESLKMFIELKIPFGVSIIVT